MKNKIIIAFSVLAVLVGIMIARVKIVEYGERRYNLGEMHGWGFGVTEGWVAHCNEMMNLPRYEKPGDKDSIIYPRANHTNGWVWVDYDLEYQKHGNYLHDWYKEHEPNHIPQRQSQKPIKGEHKVLIKVIDEDTGLPVEATIQDQKYQEIGKTKNGEFSITAYEIMRLCLLPVECRNYQYTEYTLVLDTDTKTIKMKRHPAFN